MATEVTLPALGESVSEGTVSRWLKAVGDTVGVDEPLLEISTDKVDTEIPSPVAGRILEIRFNEDDVAPVGAVLAVIGEPDQTPAPAPAATPPPDQAGPVQPKPPTQVTAAPPNTSSATEVTLPALGESVSEGTVSRWLKAVGDTVGVDEPLLEISTDKVDTEIPSPVAGRILEIRFNEDDVAPVGAVLAVIGEPDQTPAPAPAATPPPAALTPSPVAPLANPATSTGLPSAPAPQYSSAVAAAIARRAHESDPNAVYVTPLVRKLAAEHGVDLNRISGTGVGGRVRKQDVLSAAASAGQRLAPASPEPVRENEVPKPTEKDLRGRTEKLSRLRTTIAKRMTESLKVAAQLTATVEVDLTSISRIRAAVKDDFRKREGASLSYLPFITKAAVEALKKFPVVNATVDEEAGTVTYADSEHIGIAVDTEKGLLVPVIRDAGDLNVSGLARKVADLAARTRAYRVSPDELTGSTFTITNYGSAGTLFDTPIINQPQVAILGTGALVKRPVVVTDRFGADTIAIRDMMYLSLTYDHRLVDGAVAARFLSAVKARLEEGAFGEEFGV